MDSFILYIIHVLYMSSLLPYDRMKILYITIPNLLQLLEKMIYDNTYTLEEINCIQYDFEQHITSVFGYEIVDAIRIRIDI